MGCPQLTPTESDSELEFFLALLSNPLDRNGNAYVIGAGQFLGEVFSC